MNLNIGNTYLYVSLENFGGLLLTSVICTVMAATAAMEGRPRSRAVTTS